MSSLVVNFNQFIDLTVNPSQGTLNTTLLHTFLHLIVDQLRLSACLIEFHGNGSASIENQILSLGDDNQCGLQVKQFEIKQEIDGNTIRKEMKRSAVPEATQLFTITNACDLNQPIGYPLHPIQSISMEQFQKMEMRVDSIHDVLGNVMPTNETIVKDYRGECNSVKALVDLVNCSKRIDALEIGVRHIAELIRAVQCERDGKFEQRMREIEASIMENREAIYAMNSDETIASTIAEMQAKINKLEEDLSKIHCKCNESDYEENLLKGITEEIKQNRQSAQDEMENLKSSLHTEIEEKLFDLKKSICAQFEENDGNLIEILTDIQNMMDAKLNKCDVTDLKKFLLNELTKLDEKIENIDCKRAMAAGVARKIFKDVTCISCGEKVLQTDDTASTQSMLIKSMTRQNVNTLNLMKLSTRSCGGNHTITVPRERIFRARNDEEEKCQNLVSNHDDEKRKKVRKKAQNA